MPPRPPCFLVRARLPGEPGFRGIPVQAPSPDLAEGCLRDRGYLVEAGATHTTDRLPDHVLIPVRPEPQAPRCPGCGYDLRGLVVSDAAVRCPECGRSDRIGFESTTVARPEESEGRAKRWRSLVGIAAGAAAIAGITAPGFLFAAFILLCVGLLLRDPVAVLVAAIAALICTVALGSMLV